MVSRSELKFYAAALVSWVLVVSGLAENMPCKVTRDVVYKSIGDQDVLLDIYYPVNKKIEHACRYAAQRVGV